MEKRLRKIYVTRVLALWIMLLLCNRELGCLNAASFTAEEFGRQHSSIFAECKMNASALTGPRGNEGHATTEGAHTQTEFHAAQLLQKEEQNQKLTAAVAVLLIVVCVTILSVVVVVGYNRKAKATNDALKTLNRQLNDENQLLNDENQHLNTENQHLNTENQKLEDEMKSRLTSVGELEKLQQRLDEGKQEVASILSMSDAQLLSLITSTIEKRQLFRNSGLSSRSLAEQFHISHKRLRQAFGNPANDKGLTEYLNCQRIVYACQLLRGDGSKTIEAIAADSGFGSLRSFQVIFKKQMGVSPSEYRQIERGKP